MPHSPLIKAVRAPISLLQRYKTDLGHHRRAIEAGEIDTSREDYLLELGQDLFDHCEFLEDKLDAKKLERDQMTKENTNLQKDNMDLRSKVEKLKAKIASLKKRAEKAPTATADTGQDSVNDAGQDGNASAKDSMGQPKPRKRKRRDHNAVEEGTAGD